LRTAQPKAKCPLSTTGDLGCVVGAELKKNAPPESFSKTRVFKRVKMDGKIGRENGLNVSQN
jgi:hypothetical protein